MSILSDTTILRAHFLTHWTHTDVVLDGDAPADRPTGAYVRLSILHNQEQRLTIGTPPRYERSGIVWVDIFTPASQPDGQALDLIDKASALFRDFLDTSAGILRCQTVENRQGETEDGFRRHIVTIGYRSTSS